MKSQSEGSKDTSVQASANDLASASVEGVLHFEDNRPNTLAQHKLMSGMNATAPVQMKKDAAEHVFGDKNDPANTTATKVIKQKTGGKGLFKFKYVGGNCIDSFQGGNNIADKDTAKGTTYADLDVPSIAVKVSSHDLSAGDTGLKDSEITDGGRAKHFSQADAATGNSAESRKDKYTWHHLQTKGMMELIDMNVHGAMWHYGGIAGWKGSTHDDGDSDDDATDDS